MIRETHVRRLHECGGRIANRWRSCRGGEGGRRSRWTLRWRGSTRGRRGLSVKCRKETCQQEDFTKFGRTPGFKSLLLTIAVGESEGTLDGPPDGATDGFAEDVGEIEIDGAMEGA